MVATDLLCDRQTLMKKALFRLYSRISSEGAITRPKRIVTLCGMVIMYCQLGSLLIFSSGLDQFTANKKSLLLIVRPDILMILFGYQTQLTIIWLTLISVQSFLKIIGFLQVLMKKNKCISLIIFLIKFISLLNNSLLRVPIIIFGFFSVLNLIGIPIQPNEFSIEFIEPSLLISIFILISMIIYITSLFFDILLANQPKYSEKSSSRAHSIVHLQEYFIILLVSSLKFVISWKYYYIQYIVSSSYIAYSYYKYLPYFSTILNYTAMISWLGILLEAILLLISLLIGDYMIFQMNFLIILAPLALITWSITIKRLNYIRNLKEPLNPYLHELKTRFYLFSIVDELTEENKERIFKYFKQAGERFAAFKMQYIWESLVIKRFIKNPHLSLQKLAKVSTAIDYQGTSDNSQKNPYPCMIYLEVEYNMHTLSSRINKIHRMNDNDKAIIKYFNYTKEYSHLDLVVSENIVELISLISSDSKTNTLESKLLHTCKLVSQLQAKALGILSRFRTKKDFRILYTSFFQDILKVKDSNDIVEMIDTKFGNEKSVAKKFNMNIKEPMLIISGYHETIGEIIGGNKSICELLGIDNISQIIGKKFKDFLPKTFGSISNKMLIMYLFSCNEVERTLNDAFILDSNKNCIHVNVYLRIIFYKYRLFIITTFKVIHPVKAVFLYDNEGIIENSNKNAKKLFSDLNDYLFSLLPDIKEYLDRHENDYIFEYRENGLSLLMKKSSFVVGQFQVNSLSIEDHKRLLRARTKPPSKLLKPKKLGFADNFLGLQIRNNKNIDISRQLTFANAPAVHDFTNQSILHTSKTAKILSTTIKSCVCVHFLLSLIIVIILLEITHSLSMNNIIFDIGLMRFLSASILNSIRSIDLVSQNYTLANTELAYRGGLYTNSLKLSSLLHTYREFQIPILNENRYYFDTTMLSMYNQDNQLEEITLYDAINNIILCAQTIANSSDFHSTTSQDWKIYAYSNIPTHYLPNLNSTVFRIMEDLISSISRIFSILSYAKLISFSPPALILLASVYCLCKLEQLNRSFWAKLASIKFYRLLQVKGILIDRLSIVHGNDFVEDLVPSSGHHTHYRSLIFWPSLKLLVYALITVAFYFSIAYGPEFVLRSLMQIEIQHTCIGGMRRMLSPYTLFWGREAVLESAGREYYINSLQTYETTSAVSQMHYWDAYFVEIQDFLMMELHDSVQSKYEYRSYLELMKGHACGIINTVANCERSIVAQGVDTGTKVYLQEIETNARVARTGGFGKASLKKIEVYSKAIEKSYVFGLQVYSNYTDVKIAEMENTLILEVFAFFIVIGIWYAIMMHGIVKEMLQNINSKMKILSIFASSTNMPSESGNR